ncbi:MAG TPA: zf-HC2 domain-containing protein [Bryobacteraceae bacterium]|jgi:hypothetical protein
MTMIEHVSPQELLLAYDGELPPERQESVHAHARSCPECRAQWVRLADLSQVVATLQCPEVEFRPEETAVASLVSRIGSAPEVRKQHWSVPSLAVANTLVAVAVAITCIVLLPSISRAPIENAHSAVVLPPAVDDQDPGLPAGYVSLPYADPALPIDDSEVLPVELTAEDLELMGLSSSDAANDSTQDKVQAEILIGMDGWPRAIRIVQ